MTPIMEVRAFQREPQKTMKGMIIMSRKLASIQRIWNGSKKEGIVIRPTEPVFSSNIGAELSMKVVSNRYLLKNDD